MRMWGNDTVRGGQTVFHGFRMWGQLGRAGLILTAALVLAVPGIQLWRENSGHDAYAAAMLTLAELKLAIGYAADSGQEVRLEDGESVVATIADIAAHDPWQATRGRMLDTVYAGARLGAGIGAGSVLGLLLWFRWRGHRLKRLKRLRGAELVSMRHLRRRVDPLPGRVARRFAGAPAPYRIAGVPYPARAETQHTIVSGTTGSGKTVLISDLVRQIRQRGERCIIYDKMGSYTQAFFDPLSDVLLNPLDARAPRWSPLFEARTPRDFDTMAAALIPQQKDTVDPFWVTAARQLFSNGAGVLWRQGERKNRVLVEHLLKTDLSELAEAMEGTVAQSIVDLKNPKTALSVRAMLTASIGAMEVLADSGRVFSIRDWVAGEGRRRTHRMDREDRGDSFLFLTSRGDQHASLRGLISTWLEIAVNALLSLEQDDRRRVWVILDELPTLHRVPSLQPGLAESRQFGGCFVLGVQVASALRDLYGRNAAETLSALCGTRVVLAAPDSDTAQWSAEALGRTEVEAFAEGVSYGADSYRDGVTLTPRRELRPLVLPSEIMRLDNLNGYLKLPGRHPVARIALKYVKRAKIAPRFVPRRAAPDRAAPGSTAAPSHRAKPGNRAVPGEHAADSAAARSPAPARNRDAPASDCRAPAHCRAPAPGQQSLELDDEVGSASAEPEPPGAPGGQASLGAGESDPATATGAGEASQADACGDGHNPGETSNGASGDQPDFF